MNLIEIFREHIILIIIITVLFLITSYCLIQLIKQKKEVKNVIEGYVYKSKMLEYKINKEWEKQEKERKIKQIQIEEKEKQINIERKVLKEKINNNEIEKNQIWEILEDAIINKKKNDGYMVIDLPDNLRSVFHDLMKSFEDYAKLKGYDIAFSIDNTVSNKMAFKFTLRNKNTEISEDNVRQDISEFVKIVESGDNLIDDIPVIISEKEHKIIVKALKQRINLLIWNSEKEKRQFYEKFFDLISKNNVLGQQNQSIQIGTVGEFSTKYLAANNSPNSFLGDGNKTTIKNSFNETKEQIKKIDEIIRLIVEEKQLETEKKQEIVINFKIIRDELEKEKQTDKLKINELFRKIKRAMENVTLTHRTATAIEWLYNKFYFLSFVANKAAENLNMPDLIQFV